VLAARKNTRDFAPVSWEPEPSHKDPPKSSLDGALECVIHETEYPPPPSSATARLSDEERKRRKAEYDRKAVALRKIFDAGPHEKLSGVDLLKRLGAIPERSSGDVDTQAETVASVHNKEKDPEAFPSTSHMAALPFLAGLHALAGEKTQQIAEWKEQYIASLRNIDISRLKQPGNPILFMPDTLPEKYRANEYWKDIYSLGEYDGALLYPERFPNVVGDTQVFQDAREQFQEAVRLLDDFLQKIGIRPTPYYALLVADGDSMGKTIDSLARRSDGIQQHKALSEALATFSQQVEGTIEKHMGVRIYSGGDDVLALLPLHEAVECAHELSTKFWEALKMFSYEDNKSPTLSAGLAIVHHLHPLEDALKIARQAEKRAKKGQKKNALAITVQKRGGPPCKVGGLWDQFAPRLKQQIKFSLSGIIPSGMAYELEEVALRLEAEGERKAELSLPHVQYAALRVFQRKLAEAGKQEQKREEALLTLYALKRMVGLIDPEPNNERETPEQAFTALQKKLNLKDGETERLKSLREQTSNFNQLQPVRVGQLASELIVARLLADARLLAQGGTNKEGEQA
jgi:CRISPR-associated protein Cmr2